MNTRAKYYLLILFSLSLVMIAVGCGLGENQAQAEVGPLKPTIAAQPDYSLAKYAAKPLAQPDSIAAQACIYPSGWVAYAVGEKETADTVAARFGLSVASLLSSNCLTNPASVVQGAIVYVPPPQTNTFQTILPLSVSHFSASPMVVAPNGLVTLTWIGQGSVRGVRIGTVFNGQYYEIVNNLPSTGTFQVNVPADGRDSVSYVVLVNDGVQEISALTSVQIICDESWFFAPAPSGCPSALLVTTFYEQPFERGTIVYIPALGVHYVLVRGQEAVMVEDDYVPGMPDYDPALMAPAGLVTPKGAIFYLWRNEGVRQALGYAVSEAIEYTGMMQRTVSPSGEVVYLYASSGNIYRLGKGLVWGVIIPE